MYQSNDPKNQAYGGYPAAGYPPPQGAPIAGYPPPQGPPQFTYNNYPPQTQGGFPQAPPPAALHPQNNGGVLHSLSKPVGFDPESLQHYGFAEKAVRNGFIRKVLFIIAMQLAVTVAASAFCYKNMQVRTYVVTHYWVFWAAWGVALALVLVLSCSHRARRHHPTNILLLAAFTLAEAFLIGVITARYESRVVLMAFAVTCTVVFATAIFACQTKWDITSRGGILMVLLIVLLVLMLVGIFWVNKVYHLIIAGFGAILFTFYLMYDIQLLMGNRQHAISPDEYVFAALTIYLDIVNMFQFILSFIGLSSSN